MRCPNCNKFVPYDEPQVEVSSSDVQGETVTGSVRIVLCCADCNEELKDAELDFEMTIEHECPKAKKDDEPEFELEGDVDATATDRYQDKDRHGKPIKSMRYQKHFYGAELTATVKCTKCEEIISVETTVEEQARGFNELV